MKNFGSSLLMDLETVQLNGPASVDPERPVVKKKRAKKRQQGRKKQRLSEAETLASQTYGAMILSFQSLSDTWWEEFMEERHRRNDEERYRKVEEQRRRLERENRLFQEKRCMMAQISDLDTVLKRSEVVLKMGALSEELIDALQKLDEVSHESLETPCQKRAYEVRQKAVEVLNAQYIELRDSLDRTSQRRLEHEEHLKTELETEKAKRGTC